MAFNWTDPTLETVQPIKRTHITELDTNYKSVEGSVTFNPAVSTTFTTVNAAAPRKIYLNELRTAINNMETKYSNNCNCLTNPNCCQTCQACQSCQTTTCQTASCQSCQANCVCNCDCDCNCGESH